MEPRRKSRPVLLAALCVFALLLVSCAASSDPSSWEESEEQGGKIRENFLAACQESNADAGGEGDVPAYCQCSFGELRDFYADDFDGFKTAEAELRADPEAINNPAIIPAAVVAALDGCATEHLAAS